MANASRFFWILILLGFVLGGIGVFAFGAGLHLLEFGAEGCGRSQSVAEEAGCNELQPGHRWVHAGMTMMPIGVGLVASGTGIGVFRLVRRRTTPKPAPR